MRLFKGLRAARDQMLPGDTTPEGVAPRPSGLLDALFSLRAVEHSMRHSTRHSTMIRPLQ